MKTFDGLNSCRLKQDKAHLNSRTATSHTTTTYPSSQREIPDTHTRSSQSALYNVDFTRDKIKTEFDLIQKLWQREQAKLNLGAEKILFSGQSERPLAHRSVLMMKTDESAKKINIKLQQPRCYGVDPESTIDQIFDISITGTKTLS